MNQEVASGLTVRSARSSRLVTVLAGHARTYRAQLALVSAILLYLGFACYMTWPLITDPAHTLYGAPGDPYGTIAFYRTLVDHGYNPFLPGTMSQFGAPAGIPIPWPRDLAAAPGTLSLYLLTACFGAVAAFGLYSLAGYTLTGVVTFLFARRLTGNTWAALLAGWAYAFYPFAAISGRGHVDFAQGWVLMLAVWRTVELLRHPTRRNGLLAGLAVVLAMWWSPYFILFAGVAYVAVTACALLLAWRGGTLRAALGPQLVAAAIIVVFLAGLALLSTAGAAEGIGTRTHTVQELNFYAARLPEYVVPDSESPLFGGDTKHYLEALWHGGSEVENSLYIGGTVLLLALAAIFFALRRRFTSGLSGAVIALALTAALAVVTSLPPEAHIFGVMVPFPSHFILQVSESWRVYSRLVLIVMLACAVLAAIGLDALTRGRAPWLKIGIMSLATIAIPLDLWTPQHGRVEKLSTPHIYRTLARQPPGLVAEYPLAAASFNTYSDIFFQGAYNKPLINGYQEDSFQERLALSLDVLADPTTAPRLATLGVRYVLLDASPASWGAWPPAGKPGSGFRLIAHEPYADLYLVTAQPQSPALAAAGEGFGVTELTKSGTLAWLEQPSGTVNLVGTCTKCRGVLSMTLLPYAQPRQVTIRDSHGRTLAHGTVGQAAPVKIPLKFSRHTSIEVIATPQGSETSPSVAVADPEFAGSGGVGAHT
jgi:hypothetical protein